MTASTATAASAAPGPPQLLVVSALATVYVVWGSTYLAIRFMVEEIPPLLGAGARFLTAGLLLGGVLALRGGPRRLAVTRRQLQGCALIGLLLPVMGQGLVTLAEDGGAPSGITALLIAAVPLWVIGYRVLAGDRPAGWTAAGAVVGFCGMVVLVVANGLDGAFPAWTLAAVLVSGLSWAFGSWYQPRLRLPRDPFVVAVYEMLVGGGVLTIVGAAMGEPFDPVSYSARSWAAWGYLVLFGSVLAFSAYIWLLQSTATSLVATYAYVNPLVAMTLGWLILAEPVTVPTLVGSVVVVLAVATVVRCEFRQSRESPMKQPLQDTNAQHDAHEPLTTRSGSMMKTKTFVLIHGGGDSGWSWHLVAAELRARGHDVVAPDLPGDDESTTLTDYADAVVEAAGGKQNLVVVGHSFGAFTAPLVADRLPVDALVLMAGMIPSPGESPDEWWSNTGYRSAVAEQAERDGGLTGSEDPYVSFYHDVPRELAETAMSKERAHPSTAAMAAPWPLAAWPNVPTRFVLCSEDRFFPPDFARRLVSERLGIVPDEIAGSHCVALSRPREVAELLESCTVTEPAPSIES